MTQTLLKVFISATSEDLKDYRAAVREALWAIGHHPISMEMLTPTTHNPVQECYNRVQEADIFVGIYAHRYGYQPDPGLSYVKTDGTQAACPGDRSITHLEYEWAAERGLEMRIFILADKDKSGQPLPWPEAMIDQGSDQERLAAFLTALKTHHTVGFFDSPQDLRAKVATAFAKLSVEKPPAPAPEPIPWIGAPPVPRGETYAPPGLSPLRRLTRPLWERRVERQFCAQLVHEQKNEAVDPHYQELLGKVDPRFSTLYVANKPYYISQLIFGTRETRPAELLIVLGAPGSGKSTVLRNIALAQAAQKAQKRGSARAIPLYVDLKFYTGGTFQEFIQRKIAAIRPGVTEKLYREWLRNGRMTLYLDSLNEMPREHYRQNILQIQEFIETYHRNQFVIACRKDEYRHEIKSHRPNAAVPALILPLRDDDIHNFIRQYMDDPQEAEAFFARLKANDLLGLVSNPFLLTIIIATSAATGSIPHNRSQLFKAYVALLFQELNRNPKIEVKEPELRRAVALLAYHTAVERGVQDLERAQALKLLLGQTAAPPDEIVQQAVASLWLRSYESSVQENIGFWHQSIQSFFAAQHIARAWRSITPAQLLLLLTRPEFWEIVTMVGQSMSLPEGEAFARLILDTRQDVVGQALAYTILDGGRSQFLSQPFESTDPAAPPGELPETFEALLMSTAEAIAAFLMAEVAPDDSDSQTHALSLTSELASVVRLSDAKDLQKTVARALPSPKAIRVLSEMHTEESVKILVDFWVSQHRSYLLFQFFAYEHVLQAALIQNGDIAQTYCLQQRHAAGRDQTEVRLFEELLITLSPSISDLADRVRPLLDHQVDKQIVSEDVELAVKMLRSKIRSDEAPYEAERDVLLEHIGNYRMQPALQHQIIGALAQVPDQLRLVRAIQTHWNEAGISHHKQLGLILLLGALSHPDAMDMLTDIERSKNVRTSLRTSALEELSQFSVSEAQSHSPLWHGIQRFVFAPHVVLKEFLQQYDALLDDMAVREPELYSQIERLRNAARTHPIGPLASVKRDLSNATPVSERPFIRTEPPAPDYAIPEEMKEILTGDRATSPLPEQIADPAPLEVQAEARPAAAVPRQQPIISSQAAVMPEAPADDLQVNFYDHIAELKTRLLRAALAVALAFLLSWFLVSDAHLDERFLSQTTKTPSPFNLSVLSLALLYGVGISLPYVFFQIFMFVAPGLTRQEKRYIYLALPGLTLIILSLLGLSYGLSAALLNPLSLGLNTHMYLLEKSTCVVIPAICTALVFFFYLRFKPGWKNDITQKDKYEVIVSIVVVTTGPLANFIVGKEHAETMRTRLAVKYEEIMAQAGADPVSQEKLKSVMGNLFSAVPRYLSLRVGLVIAFLMIPFAYYSIALLLLLPLVVYLFIPPIKHPISLLTFALKLRLETSAQFQGVYDQLVAEINLANRIIEN